MRVLNGKNSLLDKPLAGASLQARLLRGVVGALLITLIAFATFRPIIAMGFFAEDFNMLAVALQPLPDFARQIWLHASFARPMKALMEWFQVAAFGGDAQPYRIVQILTHTANCLLLYLLATRISEKWTVGLTAGVVYAGVPPVIPNAFWITGPDQQVTFFYLLSITFWISYLSHRSSPSFWIALLAFTLALFTKETGVTLLPVLILVDVWLIGRKTSPNELLRRYSPFLVAIVFYALLYLPKFTRFLNPSYGGPYAGMSLGSNVFANLAYYVQQWIVPWRGASLWAAAVSILAYTLLAYFVLVRRNAGIAFVSISTMMLIVPVLPLDFVAERYLSMPMMGWTVLFASLLNHVTTKLGTTWATRAGAAAVGLIVVGNAMAGNAVLEGITLLTRQYRLPFRPIFQEHPGFPEDTYLYFLNPPLPSPMVQGMFQLKYGGQIFVGGNDEPRPATLREHASAFVYAFDEEGGVKEFAVSPRQAVGFDPELPVDFAVPIQLQSVELVDSTARRGRTVFALVNWKATGAIDKDYTVFAHLVAPDGTIVAAGDGQPRGGKQPTSTWRAGEFIVDWIVLPLEDDVAPRTDYALELGWYYLPTMERLAVVDNSGRPVTSRVLIQPFTVR